MSKKTAAILTSLLAISVLFFLLKEWVASHLFDPLLPAYIQLAYPSFNPVNGKLGGKEVIIPSHFANYIEYDKQNESSKKKQIKSFGFFVRYPDMSGLSTEELVAEKNKQTINNTMWIDVGISSGTIYPGNGFLDRRASYINSPEHKNSEQSGSKFKFERSNELFHDLIVYKPLGVNIENRVPFKTDGDDIDFFINRNNKNEVTTYIECSNVLIESAPCIHYFSLEPNMEVKVYVGYRRGMLPEWKKIQFNLTHLIGSWVIQNQ
ncbi:hypothetical protein [Azonexus sp.]|uniref:hypothetical protein n=1 Tax=Azonexus sp. TaxID=1872668 RepID=UPI0027BA3B8A|nr:hypothetical protein [Azonexus sp.]